MQRRPRVGKRRELTAILTAGEQQEPRQIGDALREQDRGFGRRLTVLQGVLRWACAKAGGATSWLWSPWRLLR